MSSHSRVFCNRACVLPVGASLEALDTRFLCLRYGVLVVIVLHVHHHGTRCARACGCHCSCFSLTFASFLRRIEIFLLLFSTALPLCRLFAPLSASLNASLSLSVHLSLEVKQLLHKYFFCLINF